MNHEYTAELRVSGATLDPDAVTRETGLQPCQIRRAGKRSHGRLRTTSMWAFDGGSPYRGDSLEEALALLLDRVEPLRDRFAKYISESDVLWWCSRVRSTVGRSCRENCSNAWDASAQSCTSTTTSPIPDSDSPDLAFAVTRAAARRN